MGSFRYFACGEYGDNTSRPHFHAIIFGLDFVTDDPATTRKKSGKNPRGDFYYSSEPLNKIWGNGRITIGQFNYQTAAYTARYVMKKQTGKQAADHESYTRLDPVTGELYQVAPEFALMSRKPGLGSLWYDKYKTDAFPSDFLVHEGKKHVVPAFYYRKLQKEDENLYKLISKKRKSAREDTANDNTSDRLFTKFTVKKSKLSQLQRTL